MKKEIIISNLLVFLIVISLQIKVVSADEKNINDLPLLNTDNIQLVQIPYIPGEFIVRFKTISATQKAIKYKPKKVQNVLAAQLLKNTKKQNKLETVFDDFVFKDKRIFLSEKQTKPIFKEKSTAKKIREGFTRTTILKSENVIFENTRKIIKQTKILKAQEKISPFELENLRSMTEITLSRLRALPDVEYAEPNYINTVNLIPNDPYFSSSNSWGQGFNDLYGLHNVGISSAWDITKGTSSVVVAISDTGIDYTHQDIQGNIWKNKVEISGNGVDDDNNGYVDDIYGYDFHGSDSDPLDDNGHGTHVAGTVAATINNSVGVVGVCPSCTLMAVKGLSANGGGGESNLAQGIIYAVQNGAKVINASWGREGQITQTLSQALDYAYLNNVTFVAAAGNNNGNISSYVPSGYTSVIAVGAVGVNNNKASFSNYGVKLDVMAPGVSILSTRGSSLCSNFNKPIAETPYCVLNGTSMASPHVAGLVGILLSSRPSLTPEQIRHALRVYAKPLGGTQPNELYGYGLIQASTSLQVSNNFPTIFFSHQKEMSNVSGIFIINGKSTNLASWTLEEKQNGANTWTLLTTGTGNIQGSFFNLNTTQFPSGWRYLKLTGISSQGINVSDVIKIGINNYSLSPINEIYGPNGNDITIKGTVFIQNSSYSLSICVIANCNETKQIFASGNTEIINGTLGLLPRSLLVGTGEHGIFLNITNINSSFEGASTTLVYFPDLRENFPQVKNNASISSLDVVTTDLENDGIKEMLVSSSNSDSSEASIYIYKNDGSIKRTITIPAPGGESFPFIEISRSPLTIEDINGDGEKEILFMVETLKRSYLYIYKATGEHFGNSPILLEQWDHQIIGGNNWTSVVVADLNHDGQKEIITKTFNKFFILNNQGNIIPGFPQSTSIPFVYTLENSPVIGQFDSDYDFEILLKTFEGKKVVLYAFNMDGTRVYGLNGLVLNPDIIYGNGIEESLVIADLDHDGIDEVIVAGQGLYGFDVYNNLGQLVQNWSWPRVGDKVFVGTPAVVDIDNDENLEIVSAYYTFGNNDGLRTYLAVFRKGNNWAEMVPGWPVSTGMTPTIKHLLSPVVVDINRDGVKEVFIALRNGIYGFFSNSTTLPTFPRKIKDSTALGFSDLDNNGSVETIIRASEWQRTGQSSLYVFNTGFLNPLNNNVNAHSWEVFQKNLARTGRERVIPTTTIPTITTVQGPASIDKDMIGNWIIHANNPDNIPISFSVSWGDGSENNTGFTTTTEASFSHVYTGHNPRQQQIFKIKDIYGNESATSSYVEVSNIKYEVKILKSPTNGTLVKSSDGNISCGSVCSVKYPEGATIILTASSTIYGSSFLNWSNSVGKECHKSTSSKCVLSDLKQNQTLTAEFKKVFLSVTIIKNGLGKVIGKPTGINCGRKCLYNYQGGTLVTFTASPNTTSTFVGWSGACASFSSSTRCTILIDGNKEVIANFSQ